ncbi:MAG: hypothetical protein QUU85_06670, partial [Candidatus Eisenbacteria bacterium]|nr:hypothetical protein [Candidatus Eisenbacteria bacterium]
MRDKLLRIHRLAICSFLVSAFPVLGAGDPIGGARFVISPYRSSRALTVSIEFDPSVEIQGWSFGLAHDRSGASIAS